MKDWLVCPSGARNFWLTRIEVLPNGRHEYLCGCCDGPLEGHVVALFESTRGAIGVVASPICWRCNLLLVSHDDQPTSELDAQIELLLAKATDT